MPGILQDHLLGLSPISHSLASVILKGPTRPEGDLHLTACHLPLSVCPTRSWLSGTASSPWRKILLFFWPLV